MRSYGQFCPVAKAAEIFAERWTPLLLRELFCGSVRFNDLRRGVPLMSPTLLSRRLKELERAGIVERTAGEGRSSEYHLTEAGRELWPLIEGLGIWGKRWTRSRIENRELDAGLLMWDVHRSLNLELFPRQRTVIRFELLGASNGKRLWWLMIDRGEVELCLLDPGFPIDLYVRTPLRVLTEVWVGDRDFGQTLRARTIELDGTPELARVFPRLFQLSPLTEVERQR